MEMDKGTNQTYQSKVKDGAVLMYSKDGILYPVAMTESELHVLQILCKSFEPLKVATNYPQGTTKQLLDGGVR